VKKGGCCSSWAALLYFLGVVWCSLCYGIPATENW
jgi:hypothetical protein